MAGSLAILPWLMDRDRKSTALKSLQGKIWKAGFESGELKGTAFDDVPAAFGALGEQGSVAIYSSGSVEAQKLFFRYSNFGDLDAADLRATSIHEPGLSWQSASYAAIARGVGRRAERGVVLSPTR